MVENSSDKEEHSAVPCKEKEKICKEKVKIELPEGTDSKTLINAFADSKRLAILDLLSKKEMTVSQLGEKLDFSPQNAYHHIKKLVDSGIVKLDRVEVDKNYVEKYYSTTVDLECVGCMLHEIEEKFGVELEDKKKIKIALLGFALVKINKAINLIEKASRFGEINPCEFSVAISACTIPTSKLYEVLEKYNKTMETYLEELEKEGQKDEDSLKHAYITLIMPTK
ncbi:MAG: ArsR/SmtB family transcription factor [Candidatus Wukongarchaeota archaeon]|nr:helix-turn-helix domain-containing protein [Candidatus Wukongarchaeota archaeon]